MQPNDPYQQNVPQAPQQPQLANDYSFITNPSSPNVRRSLPGSGSPIMRAVLISSGLLVLIILFVVIKGLLSGGGPGPVFLDIAQDQKALIHLTENAGKEQSLSGGNKNFAITAELGLRSDQSKTINYIVKNHTKVTPKQVNLKISLSLDKQLSDAAIASNYNSVFATIMKTKLTNYDHALQQAYSKTSGPKGRDLLRSEHNNTVLLLKQLEAANQ